jgi:hypothetical protein
VSSVKSQSLLSTSLTVTGSVWVSSSKRIMALSGYCVRYVWCAVYGKTEKYEIFSCHEMYSSICFFALSQQFFALTWSSQCHNCLTHVCIQYLTLLFVMHFIHAVLYTIYIYYLHYVYIRVLIAQCWGLTRLSIYTNLTLSACRYHTLRKCQTSFKVHSTTTMCSVKHTHVLSV